MKNDKQPILLKNINIEAAGKNAKVLIGDINSDGRMEIVAVQAKGEINQTYDPNEVQAITSFDLEGNILWQVGKTNDEPSGYALFGSDFPVQIADIDGDGANEILCVMNKKFYILNGIDGKVKKQFELPDKDAHDCIIIANLSGSKIAQDIILKNRYGKMWAVDKNFNLLWEHTGNVGHFPWIYDINQDGKDEVMAGYDMLDSNGNILWSCKSDLDEHADCITIGKILEDDKIGIVIGGATSATVIYDIDGNELCRYKGARETQHIAVGKYRDDVEGLQIAGLDRIKRGSVVFDKLRVGKDGIFILDINGNELLKEDRKTDGWLTIIENFYNWGETKKDYILAYRRGGGVLPRLYNGDLETIVEFPKEGYVVHGELLNDGNECVIIYSDGEASIYCHKRIDLNVFERKPIKQSKRLYTSTLYPGADY